MRKLKYVYKQKSFYTMSSKSTKKQTNIDIKNKQKEYNEIGLDNIVSIDEVPFYREMVVASQQSLLRFAHRGFVEGVG